MAESGKTGNWNAARRLVDPKRMKGIIDDEFTRVSMLNGQIVRRNIVKGVQKGRPEWRALSPVTARAKGSSAPLQDTGQMRNSVAVVPIPKKGVFVGVPRSVRDRNGKPLVRLGAVHEFGAKIRPVRAKKLFIPISRKGKKLGPSGARSGQLKRGEDYVLSDGVTIPKRPWIQPGIDESIRVIRLNWKKAGENVGLRMLGVKGGN